MLKFYIGFLGSNARLKLLQQEFHIGAHFLGKAYLDDALFRINSRLASQAVVCFKDELDKVDALRIDAQGYFRASSHCFKLDILPQIPIDSIIS